MRDGRAAYVTVVADCDVADGWRDRRQDGGSIVDVGSGEIVTRGLSMPHSPRVHSDRVWVLESGTGQFQTVDVQTGRRTVVAELPGFTRGLAFAGPYAFAPSIQGKHDAAAHPTWCARIS